MGIRVKGPLRGLRGLRTDFQVGDLLGRKVEIRIEKNNLDSVTDRSKHLDDMFDTLDRLHIKGLLNGYIAFEDYSSGYYMVNAYVKEGVDVGQFLRGLPVQRRAIGTVGDST